MTSRELCEKYTDLSQDDIDIILGVESTLQATAELMDANVFLDCMSKEGKAVVIAEALPLSGNSSYKDSVVGQYALEENEPAVYKTLRDGIVTKYVSALTQEEKFVIQNVAPVRNRKGDVIAVLILEKSSFDKELYRNVDENTLIFDESFENIPKEFQIINENMDFITENIDNSIIIFNNEGVAIYASKMAENLYGKLGYSKNILNRKFEELSLDNNTFNYVTSIDDKIFTEVNIKNHFLEIRYGAMGSTEGIKGLNMTISDVTDKVLKDKELMLKAVVIKEIHHRVKNNLQTVVSLLRLQARRVDNDYVKKAFQESISRISSIALTHELLAQEGIDEVFIIDIIRKLSDNILRYIESSELSVEIKINGDDFPIESDRSTSIALVVNELIQNSIEHGFYKRDNGLISIAISRDDNLVDLVIKDDGIGFNIDEIDTNSLGLNIVEQLVKDKLNGILEILSDEKGTKVNIQFKI